MADAEIHGSGYPPLDSLIGMMVAFRASATPKNVHALGSSKIKFHVDNSDIVSICNMRDAYFAMAGVNGSTQSGCSSNFGNAKKPVICSYLIVGIITKVERAGRVLYIKGIYLM